MNTPDPSATGDFGVLARRLVAHCGAAQRETIRTPQPSRRRTLIEKHAVMRDRTKDVRVDAGPHPTAYVVTGVLLALAIIVFIATRNPAGSITLAVIAGIAGFVLAKFVRRRRVETTTYQVEELVDVAREIEETVPDLVEERVLPHRYRVKTIGRLRLRCHALAVRDRSVLTPPEGLATRVDLPHPVPDSPQKITQQLAEIDRLTTEVPHVLGPESGHGVAGRETGFGADVPLRGEELALHQQHEELAAELTRLGERKLELACLPSDSDLVSLLQPSAADTPANATAQQLREVLAELERGREFDRALRAAIEKQQLDGLTLHGVRYAVLRAGVSPVCRDLGQVFHHSAFNFYCPTCTADAQKELLGRDYSVDGSPGREPVIFSQSARCRFEVAEGRWRCASCESLVDQPLPVHRVLDELFFPTFDRLMEEHKVERLRIYSKARDDEVGYRNQFQHELETLNVATRRDCDELRDEIERCMAEVSGENKAIEEFGRLVVAHSLAQTAIMAEAVTRGRAIEHAIEQDRTRTRKSIDEEFHRRRQDMVQAMMECSRAQRIEEEARDSIQRDIAANTKDIALTNREVAANTREIAVNTKDIAQTNRQIVANTGRIADHTGQIATHTRRSTEIQAAAAAKLGVKTGPAWFDLPGQVSNLGASLTSTVLGEDDVKTAARKMRALS